MMRGSHLTLVAWAAVGAQFFVLPACIRTRLEGTSNSYVVIDQLMAASGADPSQFGGQLSSDVVTLVRKNVSDQQVCAPVVFQDHGRAELHLALKDPGSASAPTSPTSANTITLTRYHVEYVRADGRNTPGVDVPYAFDGALTLSITDDGSTADFVLVRLQAKEEAPLKALAGSGALAISTMAEITFYGADQAGRAVSVKGFVEVDFADWADKDC
jgi:hypothetical protein